MTAMLTNGAIYDAFSKAGTTGTTKVPEVVVQVVVVKPMPSQGPTANDRYKMVVSDGTSYITAMLASQLNPMAASGALAKYSIIKLKQYMVNIVNGGNNTKRRIMIVVELEILGQETVKIGEPVDVAEFKPNPNMESYSPAPAMSNMNSAFNKQNPSTKPFQIIQSSANVKNESNPSAQSPQSVLKIKMLNPYQNKWTICARVLSKSDIRTWSNAKGEGKLFSCTFVDSSGEIRATGFNDAVDNHYEMLQENCVYYISKAQIKAANKQYSSVQNDYEMTLDADTMITPCGNANNVPGVTYNPTLIENLINVEKDSNVDIIAVVKETGPLTELLSKAQKQLKKRELTLVDASGYQVRLTLWGRNAESFENEDSPIIAVKGVKVGDFGGRSLSMSVSSIMTLNPDLPQAHQLRGWYDSSGSTMNFQAFNASSAPGGNRQDVTKPVSCIKDENLGAGDKADYVSVRAVITYIRPENLSYAACPTCGKKVLESGSGWRCEKCDRSYPEPQHRYVMSLTVSDFSGQVWISAFNDAGAIILGKTADEVNEIKQADPTAYEAFMKSHLGKEYVMKLKIKSESYQDEMKIKSSVISAEPVDYAKASTDLLELINYFKIRLYMIFIVLLFLMYTFIARKPLKLQQPIVSPVKTNSDPEKMEFVKKMMLHAWKGYKAYAWNSDELEPLAKTGNNWTSDHSLLMTPVDALDTLFIMNATQQFNEAKDLILNNLNFDVPHTINVFETIIRILGGLLSAYDLSGDVKLLLKAKDLADRMLNIFNSKNGLPGNGINLKTGEIKNADAVGLAEIGTMQLEFQYLSDALDNQTYAEKALHIYDVIWKMMENRAVQMVPDSIDIKIPAFREDHIGIGAGSDSFYEYLMKLWVYTGNSTYYNWYEKTADTMTTLLVTKSATGRISFPDRARNQSTTTFHHLSCFGAGMLSFGAIKSRKGNWSRHLNCGIEFAESCYKSYELSSTGLGGETILAETLEVSEEESYYLRPEVVESIFYLWRLTHDLKYRTWGWKIVQSIEKNCKNSVGYHGLKSATEKNDRMESFFLAETLKYLYLLFADDNVISLDEYVFNTEAHPFSIRGHGRMKHLKNV